jgi:hypothetical protein
VLCTIISNLYHDTSNTFECLCVFRYYIILKHPELQNPSIFLGFPVSVIYQNACWLTIERGYMVLCGYCRKNVKPKMYLTWKGFVCSLGIFYFMYVITKIPHCPICNFPMPRRNMIFALMHPQYLIKIARMIILQLVYFRDRVVSASQWVHLSRKFDLSQYFSSMNKHQFRSFNMIVDEVHRSMGLENDMFRK